VGKEQGVACVAYCRAQGGEQHAGEALEEGEELRATQVGKRRSGTAG